MFEHDICVDLPDVLGGKPNYVNAPLSELFPRACEVRPEVLDGKPVLVPSGVAAVKVFG